MQTKNYIMTRTNLIIVALIALFAIALALLPANAQESEEVEYEFSFQLENAESSADRQSRLEDEVSDYCDGLSSSNSGIYASDCEAEITTAVNDQMEEQTPEDVFAAR